ncbi:hypothetical protein ACFQRK_19365 [Parapedobacter sp. GCM10030251]|uniref:hypothetical protein n=1 Tax=Parapedobacter sp. GCM10030251 TaxID=3273419 RepID=UPI0036153D51
MRTNHLYINLVIGFLIFISLAITAYFLCRLNEQFTYVKGEIEMAETGQVGDFIGGTVGTIISLGALILVYITYLNQRVENEKSKIDEKFFNMINLHKANVSEMEYINPYDPTEDQRNLKRG